MVLRAGHATASLHAEARLPMPSPLLVLTPQGALHRTPSNHPEASERLRVVARAVLRAEHTGVQTIEDVRPLDPDELLGAHAPAYLDRIAQPTARYLDDGETWCGPGSFLAARAAAGAAVRLIDEICTGPTSRMGFAATRPPGHHAHHDHGSGYCILNNALLAVRALRRHGVDRVAVLDIDAHHGDGTEAGLRSDPNALYLSVHESNLFPAGYGLVGEHGTFGNVLNVPLAPGSGDADLLAALHVMASAVERFRADALILLMGTDGHVDDPMSHLVYTSAGIRAAIATVAALADRCCAGRLAVLLEGGYDYTSLEQGVVSCLEELARREPRGLARSIPTPSTKRVLDALFDHHPLLQETR